MGHDLMSPYILLRDQARTSSIAVPSSPSPSGGFPPFPKAQKVAKSPSAALNDFLSYTDRLLAQPSSASAPLLSPTSPTLRRHSSIEGPRPSNMKEAIDLAILRSNQISEDSSQSPNRFTIARGGHHVAVLTLLRPAYRLGESVIGTLDFVPPPPDQQPPSSSASPAPSPIPVYNVTVTLETTERIDPSLALRSSSSVQRATRKPHAGFSETVLFSRRTGFRLEVPSAATPSFETTGVRLAWRVRVEFSTGRLGRGSEKGLGISGAMDEGGEGGGGGGEGGAAVEDADADGLLEEVGRDERGRVLVAKERLLAESWEVAVPIKVFGVAGGGVDGGLGQGELAEFVI